MQAIQLEACGHPAEILTAVDIPDVGAPAAGAVVIALEASPINPYDRLDSTEDKKEIDDTANRRVPHAWPRSLVEKGAQLWYCLHCLRTQGPAPSLAPATEPDEAWDSRACSHPLSKEHRMPTGTLTNPALAQQLL